METSPNGSDLIERLDAHHHPELSERIELRASKEDVERWRQAGELRGLTLSAYVRQSARELALHPAIARGALEGAWLELAQRGVDTLGRIMAELADRTDVIRTTPVDVTLRVQRPFTLEPPEAAAAAPAKKKPRKKLAMKHANRKKPAARSKGR